MAPDTAARPLWRRLLHVHYDPDWQTRGVWRYFECRCGARRVSRATRNLMGPSDPAWPSLRDRHGEHVDDSGWSFDYDPTKTWPDPSKLLPPRGPAPGAQHARRPVCNCRSSE